MDIVSLVFRANTKALDDAQRKLDGVEKELGAVERAQNQTAAAMESGSKRASGAVGMLTNSVKTLLLPLITLTTAVKFLNVAREAEVLQATLATATGSAQNAAIAFSALQSFAAKTPYDLNQVTESFTKLVNLGLTPSERALTSYGNTSSALGKDLNQMIEAVADAATGEFERLKEFGIRAKKEGDQVKLTFRGVTTNVKNNAKDIENYLIGLGEVEFAGAMDKRMQTLDGAISNLGDSFTKLATNISNSGVGSAVATIVRGAVDALEEINAWFESGQLRGYLDAFVGLWMDNTKEIRALIGGLIDWISDIWNRHGEYIGTVVRDMIKTWATFPANVRAFIQTAVVQVAAFVDKVKAYGSAMAEYLNPFGKSTSAVTAELRARLAAIEQVEKESIVAIDADRTGVWLAVKEKIAAADAERKAWEARNKALTGDQLAKFGRGGAGGASSAGDSGGKGAKETKPGNGVTDFDVWLKKQRDRWRNASGSRPLSELIEQLNNERASMVNSILGDEPGRKTADFLKQLKALDDAFFNEEISSSEFEFGIKKITSSLKGATDEAKTTTEQVAWMERIGTTAFKGFEDTLMSFAETGKFSFRDMVSSILRDLGRLVLQMMLIQPMLDAFKKSFSIGGGGMGSLVGNLFGAFGGAFAEGGNPPVGKASLVGERGPELFVPKSAGTIIPNHKLGGGGTQNVQVQVNVKVEGSGNAEQTANAVSMKLQEQFTRGVVRQEIATWQRGRAYAV